jgi:hypothetical protein
MTFSQTPFLAEIAAGHSGPPIPAPKRAYFQQRLRNRVFNFLLAKFVDAQESGLTKAILARRIGKTPDLINRWLGVPANLTLDTISDLLLGIAGEELELESSSPLTPTTQSNYSYFADLSANNTNVSSSAQRSQPNSALSESTAEYKQKRSFLLASIGAQ